MLGIRDHSLEPGSRLARMKEAQCTDVLAFDTDEGLADKIEESCNLLRLEFLKTVLMQGNAVQLLCTGSCNGVFQLDIRSEFGEPSNDLAQYSLLFFGQLDITGKFTSALKIEFL
jgi:hypothetical protein